MQDIFKQIAGGTWPPTLGTPEPEFRTGDIVEGPDGQWLVFQNYDEEAPVAYAINKDGKEFEINVSNLRRVV